MAGRLGIERTVRAGPGSAAEACLEGRRIYILPTRFGVLYGALLFVMLLGSVNYANSMGYVLTFFLASVAIVSVLHTYLNLRGLTVAGGRYCEQFADGPVRVPLALGNRSRSLRPGVLIEGDATRAVREDLEPGSVTTVNLLYPGVRRGRFEPGRWTVSTRYPLGLFQAWARVSLGRSYLVYPAPAGSQSPLPGGPSREGSAGEHERRGADDFAGLRNYQIGDSPRHVHWKAVARGQELLTKEFAGDHSTEIWLDWGQLGVLSTEEKLSQLCRWVLQACEAGLRYGLRLPGVELQPARGEGHRRKCLEALALWQG